MPYRQALRQHQILLTARRALIELSEDESLQEGIDTAPAVLCLKSAPDRMTAAVCSKAYAEWRGKAHIRREDAATQTDHYVKKRLRVLLEAYENKGWLEGQRLVSATYSIGRRTLLLLVMMRMHAAGTKLSESERASDEAGGNGMSFTVSYSLSEVAYDP